MKLRIICFLLVLCVLVPTVIACKKEGDNTDGSGDTSNVATTDSDLSDDSNEVKEPTVLELVKEGEFQYTVVFDDSDKYLTELLDDFVTFWQDKYGVKIPCYPKSYAKADYGKEIIVGNVRESVESVIQETNSSNDFAICVSDDDLLLYASQGRMYAYLFTYLKNNLLPYTDSADNLSFSSENDYFYHNDKILSNVNYVNYLLGTDITYEELFEIFEAKSFTAEDGTELPYRIYVPYNYDPTQKYPVLTMLHGAGERGDDNKSQLKNGVSKLFSQSDAEILDAIVIAPQCPVGNQWVDTPWSLGSYSTKSVAESNELKAVMELLDQIENSYSTDTDRYYVAGLSMGGFGTWDLLMRHTDRFAAGLAICGGADPSVAKSLKNMPIYTVHGDADPTVPVSGTREMVDALKKAGSTVIVYEELQGYNHHVWDYACSKPDIQKWLFDQTRAGRSDDVVDDTVETKPGLDGASGELGDDSAYTKNY